MNDDELERRLRDALVEEAHRVRPTDRFDDILAEAREGNGSGRSWLVTAVAAALVVALGLGGAFLLVRQRTPDAAQTVELLTDIPPLVCDGESSPLAVYYARDHSLYAETQPRELCDDPATTAVLGVLRDRATDPDYRTLWNTEERVQVVETKAGPVVNLPAEAFRDDLTAADRQLALQQVAHTVVAAVGLPADAPVGIRRNGSVDLGAAFNEVTSAERTVTASRNYLAAVMIETPLEGMSLPLTADIEVAGRARDKGVLWSLTDRRTEEIVATGETARASAQQYGPFSFTLRAPRAGDYRLRVWTDADVQGDDKRVTVAG